MHGIAELVPRADPLEPGEAINQNPAAADQIGAAQRELRMARAEIHDPPQDLVEIAEVALLQSAEPKPAIIPCSPRWSAPLLTGACSWPCPAHLARTMAPDAGSTEVRT